MPMIRKIIFVEGVSDLKFMLGLLKFESLKYCSDKEGLKYKCYYADYLGSTCICDGGGKDSVCRRVNEFLQVRPNVEVHVLLDGDAKDIKCGKAVMHYLGHGNLDELVFEIVKTLVMNSQCINSMSDLIIKESNNSDSKKKSYLAMYVAWRCRDALGLGNAKYWPSVHDFYQDIWSPHL